jgi:hypothetical protein
VKSGKRETKVNIHAVVDYRNAPPPGMSPALLAAAAALAGSGTTPAASGTGGSGSGLPEGATDEAYAAVLKPGPGGNVIYYRID